MTRTRIFFSAGMLAVLVGAGVALRAYLYTQGGEVCGIGDAVTYHYARQYAKAAYEEAFAAVVQAPLFPGDIAGGVVPHHLVAAPLIARFYAGIRDRTPQVVVIIGPNHDNAGTMPVIVSAAVWETTFGTLLPAGEIIRQMEAQGAAVVYEPPFDGEHAISTHMPFIRYVFPNAVVIPVIVKSTARQEDVMRLVSALDDLLPSDSLYIASVDFSHKTDAQTALFQDSRSIVWLETGDTGSVPILDTDANGVLYGLKVLARIRGAFVFRLLEQSDAGRFGKPQNPEDITSYVSGYYVR